MAQEQTSQGHLIGVAVPGRADEDVEVLVRRGPGDLSDAMPSVAFRRTSTLDESATLFKGTAAGLRRIAQGLGDALEGTGQFATGGAAALYAAAVKLALATGVAGGVLTMGSLVASIGLGLDAEAQGRSFLEVYPQLAQGMKALAVATAGAGAVGLVLKGSGDKALNFAERMLFEPATGDLTASARFASGASSIAGGLRVTARAIVGAPAPDESTSSMRHA